MLTATLPCNLTILSPQVSQNDTGLDQAVYVPSAGGHVAYIAGVRGGYVLQFDLTGAYQGAARFCSPNFGDGAICYDTINDKLIASFWNEQNANDSPDSRGLYKINPTTFAVELFASSASLGTAIPEAIHNLNFYDAGGGSGNQFWTTTPTLRNVDPVTFLPGPFDPGPSPAGPYYPIWTDLGRDITNDQVFTADPIGQTIIQQNGQAWWTNSNPAWPLVGGGYTFVGNFDAYGICSVTNPYKGTPGIFGNIVYISTRDGKVYFYFTGALLPGRFFAGTPAQWNPVNLPGPPAMIYHLRYNPVNGKIYAPDVAGNRVFVITPTIGTTAAPGSPGFFALTLDSAITATYGGFDSPIDVVFTPGGSFAVQQGVTGLKRFE